MRRRRNALATAVAAVSLLVLTLSACGGGDEATSGAGEGAAETGGGEPPRITREQWDSITTDAAREDVVGQFGEPEFETEYEGLTDTISYRGPSNDIGASFTWNAESDDFQAKTWTEIVDPDAKVTADQFAQLRNGMTEQQVVAILGEPGTRDDEVSTIDTGAGKNPLGTLQHCLWYRWTPKSKYAASVCFDSNGKVNEAAHTGTAPPVP